MPKFKFAGSSLGYENKNETYYRSERKLFLSIWIYFYLSESISIYLNLFLSIWIIYLSIWIYLNLLQSIWIYFQSPLYTRQTSDKHQTNRYNIRSISVKHQTNIRQASNQHQTNISILQSFSSKLEISNDI